MTFSDLDTQTLENAAREYFAKNRGKIHNNEERFHSALLQGVCSDHLRQPNKVLKLFLLSLAFGLHRRQATIALFEHPLPHNVSTAPGYHYTPNGFRTELYSFGLVFGNSCSVITEPICFWNDLVSVVSASSGLPNPWIYFTETFCHSIR